MKKLKIKVFYTIFSILILFIITLLIISNLRHYNEQKRFINDVLSKEYMRFNKNFIINDNLEKRFYFNFSVYTILLDEFSKPKTIINYQADGEDENILNVANDILTNNIKAKYIGNLFINKYSYHYSDSYIIIINHTNTTKALNIYLFNTFIVLLLLVLVALLISYIITNWIVKPADQSFARQKRFIADASHELKTPLAVIMASVDAYENDKKTKWLDNIKNETERMNNLVTNLLDLAALENNQHIDMKEQNLSKIIEASILTYESLFYEKNIKLDYDIIKDIKFICNEDYIKELMSILIDNAIKHTKENHRVVINLKVINKEIILEVKNKGEGIKKEDEEKIFERFYKSDDSRNRKNNTYGLGLAIAKQIVENHHGTIKAHSEKGYTIFSVNWNQK